MCYLSFTLINDSRYDSGVCLSWNTNGSGVSTAYANFTLKVQSMAANLAIDYAANIALFYENLGSWTPVNASNNLSTVDYGNGTYLLSFTVNTSSPVQVSTHVYDLRDIFVQANITCYAT